MGIEAPTAVDTDQEWVSLPRLPEPGRPIEVRHPEQFGGQPCRAVRVGGVFQATEWRGSVAVREWRYLGPRP